MKFSVFGAAGFIGSRLVKHLNEGGHAVTGYSRGQHPLPGASLGHVFYAIGMTGDYRGRPLETAQAHVSLLADHFSKPAFDSFTYLSSTRVYQRSDRTAEDAPLTVEPRDVGDIYNLTKLTGEALCLAQAQDTVRVVRVSNVIDPTFRSPTFLSMLVREVADRGSVMIRQAGTSAKDYLPVDNLLRMLVNVATSGRDRVYNLAAGSQTTHATIAELLTSEFQARVTFCPDAPEYTFPPIDVSRAKSEFQLPDIDAPAAIRQALQNFKQLKHERNP